MKQLETKYYTRQEIAELLNLNIKSSHFARDVKQTLDKWGYAWDNYSCKGINIKKAPISAEERLNEIFNRAFNIDIRTNIYGMACFLVELAYYEEFQSMPWAVRAEELKKDFKVSVDERTLRNWASKLIKNDVIARFDSDKTAWISYKVDGVTYRELISGDDNLERDMRRYYQKRNEYRKQYRQEQLIEKGREDYEAVNSESWSFAMKSLWDEFHCCYYYCCSYYLNAIGEYAQEIFELVEEISGFRLRY